MSLHCRTYAAKRSYSFIFLYLTLIFGLESHN